MRRRTVYLCYVLVALVLLPRSVGAQETPWWDDFPRIVQTDSISAMAFLNGSVGFTSAQCDPGWATYGQMITTTPSLMTQFHNAGYKNIGYFETFGQSMCFIAELGEHGSGDFTPMLHSFWNWQNYGGGTIGWVGVHNFFDDEAFAQPYTRTHPIYGGVTMDYPDGTVATGYIGDPTDPRNSRIYDAAGSKDILGGLSLDPDYNDIVNYIDSDTGQPCGPLDGLIYIPEDDQYAGLFSFCKDSACPMWIDFTYASTLMAANAALDGMWTDNYSAWDSLGNPPVKRAFGDWSVARFRDYLSANFTPTELTTMGVTNVATFDIRTALRDQAIIWGWDGSDLDSSIWLDAGWLDEILWRTYLVFKRQAGTEALTGYYNAVKSAASQAGIDEFLVCGNDIPVFSLGWVRGDLDMVSTEISASSNQCSGERGFMIPPLGRLASFYKLAREHAQNRFVNVWLYIKGYETELAQTGVSTAMYYEMLAAHTLPMFYPLPGGENVVAGTSAGNAAFFDFVEQVAPIYGTRAPLEEIGVYYSSSTLLSRLTLGGCLNYANQPHQFAVWGWGTALGELHYQYRILPEWKLTADQLADLRVLIIPDADVFTNEDVTDVLRPWVNAGGLLIVTGVSGRLSGEQGQFSAYEGDYSLALLTGVPDINGAPEEQTLVQGAGLVHYIRENIGLEYFNADTGRPSLLWKFAHAMDTVLAGRDPVTLIPGAGVPSTVGLTVHQDFATRRLFVDVNNFDIDPSTDTMTDTGMLLFTVVLPTWMADCTLTVSVVSPDSPAPNATISTTGEGVVDVILDSVHYYASVIIGPGSQDDTDGDGVVDACDLCPDTEPGVPVRDDGCPWLPPDDTLLFHTTGGPLDGLWALSYTQLSPLPFYSGDPISGGYAVFNDATLTPNPNHTCVGDVNGDGIDDLVTIGLDASANEQVFLGRVTGVDPSGFGDLLEPSPSQGWPNNALGVGPDHYAFFLGDVDGDGRDDAIAVRDWGDGTMFWEAYNSGVNGLTTTNGSSWSPAGNVSNAPLVGDFNGDGRTDIAQRLNIGTLDLIMVCLSAADGSGLIPSPSITDLVQGTTGVATNYIATLVGDINGDGIDDIVTVDDYLGTGEYLWVADLTGPDDTPSGFAIGAGGKSWISPFIDSDPPSTLRVPMLADLNADGYDDLVEYREFPDTVNPGGDTFGQWLVAYTDPATGDLFSSVYNESGTIMLNANQSGNRPLVGKFRAHVACGYPMYDTDGDGDVDLIDFAPFAGCFTGAGGTGVPLLVCACSDVDSDDDTDIEDFAIFSTCMNGPDEAPGDECP